MRCEWNSLSGVSEITASHDAIATFEMFGKCFTTLRQILKSSPRSRSWLGSFWNGSILSYLCFLSIYVCIWKFGLTLSVCVWIACLFLFLFLLTLYFPLTLYVTVFVCLSVSLSLSLSVSLSVYKMLRQILKASPRSIIWLESIEIDLCFGEMSLSLNSWQKVCLNV